MTSWLRLPLSALLFLHLPACAGDGRCDGPDCDGPPCEGPDCSGLNLAVLRPTIGLNLAEVASFAVVNPGASAWSLGPRAPAASTSALEADQASGPQLYALTLSGEVLEVTMAESTAEGGYVMQPPVDAIFPTASWILFSTPNYALDLLHDDGTSERVECFSIAARRSDGALFCGAMGLQRNPNADARYDMVHANSAGDLMYLGSHDPAIADKELIYRLTLGGAGGPAASVVIDPWLYPQWFTANAAGDLFFVYFPTALERTTALAQVVPVDGGNPVLLEQTNYGRIIHGEFGAADEDTFYALRASQGSPDEATVWVVTKSGASFVETPQVIAFPNASMYGELYRLGDGLYMVSAHQNGIVRALVDGLAVANPTPVPFTGVDHLIEVRGSFVQAARSEVVLFVSTGSAYKFLRHDGTTQQDIPIDPSIEVVDFTAAPSGAIDFLGRRAATQEKVRGTVAPGETEVNVEVGGVLDPGQLVVFTRVN